MPAFLDIVAAVLAVLALLVVAFVLGMRTQSPLVLRPIVWISKRFMNPVQMRTAGQPGAYAAIIRAPGRRTGRMYETPVGVVAVDDTFLITTPYGTGAQWLQNVLAAGDAVLVTEGHTYHVDRPEMIAMRDVVHHFSPTDQRLSKLLAMTDCLRLRRVAEIPAAEGRPALAA